MQWFSLQSDLFLPEGPNNHNNPLLAQLYSFLKEVLPDYRRLLLVLFTVNHQLLQFIQLVDYWWFFFWSFQILFPHSFTLTSKRLTLFKVPLSYPSLYWPVLNSSIWFFFFFSMSHILFNVELSLAQLFQNGLLASTLNLFVKKQ